MNALLVILACITGILLVGLLRQRRPVLEVNSRYVEILRREGLREPTAFLDLQAVIVSGHPGRNVARLTLGKGIGIGLFLKREAAVSWLTRCRNALAGFGFVSLSLREAKDSAGAARRRRQRAGMGRRRRGRERTGVPAAP